MTPPWLSSNMTCDFDWLFSLSLNVCVKMKCKRSSSWYNNSARRETNICVHDLVRVSSAHQRPRKGTPLGRIYSSNFIGNVSLYGIKKITLFIYIKFCQPCCKGIWMLSICGKVLKITHMKPVLSMDDYCTLNSPKINLLLLLLNHTVTSHRISLTRTKMYIFVDSLWVSK